LRASQVVLASGAIGFRQLPPSSGLFHPCIGVFDRLHHIENAILQAAQVPAQAGQLGLLQFLRIMVAPLYGRVSTWPNFSRCVAAPSSPLWAVFLAPLRFCPSLPSGPFDLAVFRQFGTSLQFRLGRSIERSV
jgi:hypothetical protein